MSRPEVSVVVCVHNRPDQVRSCLESLVRLEFDSFEIVVVDDASTDGTPEALERFRSEHADQDIVIVRNERNLGVSGARNSGLEASRGRLVAFTDSDCEVEASWLDELVAGFTSPEIVAVGGTVIDAEARTLAEAAFRGTGRIGAGALQGRALIGNNMAFRTEVARSFGFEPSLAYGCDEDELAWRLESAGYRFAFAPRAIVHHDHPMRVGDYLRQARRQGQGSARYAFKRGRWISRDLLFLLAALAALPWAVFRRGALRLAAGFGALHLAALLFNETVYKGKRWGTALCVLPLTLVYTAVKLASLLATFGGIFAGREPELVASRDEWRKRIRGS